MLRPVWQGLGYDEKVGENYRLRNFREVAPFKNCNNLETDKDGGIDT